MGNDSSNQMWGGRFSAGPDAIMEAINASIGFDQRMAAQDIAGSRAHAAMLAATGIVEPSDAEAIRRLIPADTVVICAGQDSDRALLDDLARAGIVDVRECFGGTAAHRRDAGLADGRVPLHQPRTRNHDGYDGGRNDPHAPGQGRSGDL